MDIKNKIYLVSFARLHKNNYKSITPFIEQTTETAYLI